MKKIILILLCFSVALLMPISTFAAEGAKNWYVKRNSNKQPIFSESQKSVVSHGAYFIDDTVSDTSEEKVLYLTFDFGYENGNVEKIVNTLNKENIKAAFFVLANPIFENTELICRMAKEGHLICNHTKKHKDLSRASKKEIEDDITTLERVYTEKTGLTMTKYFRFPEGRYSEAAIDAVTDLGYKTFFWSFAYDDWDNSRQPSCDKAIKKVIDNTHNGAVMLFHPTSSVNAEIFPTLIKEWKRMGYRFGTLDELVSNMAQKSKPRVERVVCTSPSRA